jgi:ribosomal protein S18 acetylase RimI-like enzyme
MSIPAPIVAFRRATPADLQPLLDMMELFYEEEGIAWSQVRARPLVAKLIDSPALGAIGVVETGSRVIGYAVVTWGYDLEWGGRDSFLTEIYLVPSARGQRIGVRALSLIEEVAREEGARALHLMVRPENNPAVRLYAGAGYTSPPRTLLSKDLQPASRRVH